MTRAQRVCRLCGVRVHAGGLSVAPSKHAGVRRVAISVVCAVVGAMLVPVAVRAATPPLDRVTALAPGCDPIDPARCLLPFPDDFYTVADPSTATGRRVNLPVVGMPTNVAGKPVDPTEWNRNDGFSPGSPILTLVSGLDLSQTWRTAPLAPNRRDSLTDLSRSMRPDSPFVVIDAATSRRQPLWSEMDSRPGVAAADRLVLLHPATNFLMGHHYVVALRRLRRSDGSLIPAPATFAAYRDNPALARAQRPGLANDFLTLRRAGIDTSSLYLAWDFTVASAANLAGRALAIRNDAFGLLGDHNLADGKIEGASPGFAITKVTNFTAAQDATTARRVEGTITVPNYLTPQYQTVLTSPVALPSPIGGQTLPFSLPGSRFNYLGSRDGLPLRDPIQPDLQEQFVCDIPRAAFTSPSHPVLYGHGLLGSKDEVNGGSGGQLRMHDFTTCATDWIGFASEDLANVALVLADMSNFASVADRAQQGYLNFMFLGRALAHPGGLVTNRAFRTPDGKPLITSGRLFYKGNSQGAIMGGALTALEPDLTTSVLGVPGMNYSTLLDRSVDWVGNYFSIYKATYPDPVDQEIGYGLLQMLWDRAEADGYAQHMTSSPLPDTPAHQVLLQVALGDHQVANVTAEVEGRTIGARLKVPALRPGLHWSTDPAFGFQTVGRSPDTGGSYLVYWYDPQVHDATPPTANLPDYAGSDPHEFPRRDRAAGDQEARFLLSGQLIDTCNGDPCITTAATRSG